MRVTRMTVREHSMTHCCYSPARLSMQIEALQGNSYPLPSVQKWEKSVWPNLKPPLSNHTEPNDCVIA